MPKSSRTMVTLRASCPHRAGSGSLIAWKAKVASAAARMTTSRLMLFMSLSSILALGAAEHEQRLGFVSFEALDFIGVRQHGASLLEQFEQFKRRPSMKVNRVFQDVHQDV